MHLKKIKKKIKDGIVGLLAMFTVASTVAIPATTTPVVAEVAISSDDPPEIGLFKVHFMKCTI